MIEYEHSEIASFLERNRIEAFRGLFERFKARYRKVEGPRRNQADEDEPSFNVIKVLGVSDYEVRTHSAFIETLLDPEGSHERGKLFLERFLNHCGLKHSVPFEDGSRIQFPQIEVPWDSESWEVKDEDRNEKGRYDITRKWTMSMRSWPHVLNQIVILFEVRIDL